MHALRLPRSLPVGLLIALPLTTGCASVSVERVAAIDAAGIAPVAGSVEVRAGHGLDVRRQNVVVGAFLEDDAELLRRAIVRAVEDHGPFSSVVPPDGEADYVLEAHLAGLTHAPADLVFSIRGTSSIQWTCRDRRTGETVFDEKVRAEAVKGVGDAFNGGTRVVVAYESAVARNIQQALGAIGAAVAAGG